MHLFVRFTSLRSKSIPPCIPKKSHRTLVKLSGLKNDELRALAFRTGINSSGNKAILQASLERELLIPRLESKSKNRILSIDMGIRNLAFVVLDVPGSAIERRYASPAEFGDVTLHAWRRISVTPHAVIGLKEAFDPATFAVIAYDLVARTLLPYHPTQILIERQRYRSGGAPTVQEWTVRVNMFESMLHAVLRTLQREQAGHQSAEGWQFPQVQSVSPQKVARFYFAGADDTGGGNVKQQGGKTGKIEKSMKIAVAEDLLRGGLEVSEEARPVRDAFLRTRGRNKNRENVPTSMNHETELGYVDMSGQNPKESRLEKMDDLADCLLQALAWVQWEANRRSVIDAGTA